jgi:SulP family sulfate permease
MSGLLQILSGWLKLGAFMRFVSHSVVTGFVNALAILIFLAQIPEITGVSWMVYPMVAAGLAIIYLFPYITRAIPSPLVTIVVLTAVAIFLGIDIRTVGDMGNLPDSLPIFMLPDVPLNLDTLKIILPVSATLAVVGLLESMMTLFSWRHGGLRHDRPVGHQREVGWTRPALYSCGGCVPAVDGGIYG